MPGVDLAFSSIKFSRIPVVVLNLRAPSALLGFQLGGIVGHRFLSKYTRHGRSRAKRRGVGGVDEGSTLAPKRASEASTEMVQVVLPNDANPLGYISRRHRHASDRHRRRDRLSPPHAEPARHGGRRWPPVPASHQSRGSDHPQGAGDRRLEHVARGRGRSVLGGDAERHAADDQSRVPTFVATDLDGRFDRVLDRASRAP